MNINEISKRRAWHRVSTQDRKGEVSGTKATAKPRQHSLSHQPLRAMRTGPAEISSPPSSRLWTGPETITYYVFSVQSFLAWPCWMPEGRAGGVSTSKVALRSISSLKAGWRSFSISTGAGLWEQIDCLLRATVAAPDDSPSGSGGKRSKPAFPK